MAGIERTAPPIATDRLHAALVDLGVTPPPEDEAGEPDDYRHRLLGALLGLAEREIAAGAADRDGRDVPVVRGIADQVPDHEAGRVLAVRLDLAIQWMEQEPETPSLRAAESGLFLAAEMLDADEELRAGERTGDWHRAQMRVTSALSRLAVMVGDVAALSQQVAQARPVEPGQADPS
jgi:hypothetical protein